jgi:hypothetical protein
MLRDFLIEDNTSVNWRKQAIGLGCIENAIIRNNRLLADAKAPAGMDDELHVPIRIFNAERGR